jgi:hypothetical protein
LFRPHTLPYCSPTLASEFSAFDARGPDAVVAGIACVTVALEDMPIGTVGVDRLVATELALGSNAATFGGFARLLIFQKICASKHGTELTEGTSTYPRFKVNNGSGSGYGHKSGKNESRELEERDEQLTDWSTHSWTDLHIGVFWRLYSSEEQLFSCWGFVL